MSVVMGSGARSWSLAAWITELRSIQAWMDRQRVRVLVSILDNGPAFIALDEAALQAGIIHVPLPPFFTTAQIEHVIAMVGADCVLMQAGQDSIADAARGSTVLEIAGQPLLLLRLSAKGVTPPEGTSKITFTSGSTGTPKGVCLSCAAMDAVAASVAQALAPLRITRHLSALPYAVLLENLAGVMAARCAGATVLSLPLEEIGLRGSSEFAPDVFDAAVRHYAAESVILLPQMLKAWTAYLLGRGLRAPSSLKFVAVGGAPIGTQWLTRAHALGIPAFEGYGLSEGASVQTLNLPWSHKSGSVGQVLPHSAIRIGADSEIEVQGSLFSGYLGQADAKHTAGWWPTGDLGRIDPDGFLFIEGRKKNLLITGYGRNVSPEWVETALMQEPCLSMAVVVGDGQARLGAVVWPSPGAGAHSEIAAAIERVNANLPDYARVMRWVVASIQDRGALLTSNGRPIRKLIEAYYINHSQAEVAPPVKAGTSSNDAIASHSERPSPLPDRPIMNFYQTLIQETQTDREALLNMPIIQGALAGRVSLTSYLAFLQEAYHHVRHTVPLLAAMKARLDTTRQWLAPALDEYIEEESGHDEWILSDIRAAGGDAQAVRQGQAGIATEVMVAYAYDTIARCNPLGFFGMVHVLEGTSVSLALLAADAIQKPLRLPDLAFTYLRSHGTLDQEHTAHFEELMNQITELDDQQAIVHAARVFYRLYGEVFRSLPLPEANSEAALSTLSHDPAPSVRRAA